MSQVLNGNHKNIGLLLSPLYGYKAGALWLLDHQCQKTLTQKSCNVDRTFALVYKEKCDPRDHRPCMYPGRFVTAASVTDAQKTWKNSRLVNDCISKASTQLPAKDMKLVEDLAPNALPESARISPAHKFMQVGEDAALNLLQGLIDQAEFTDRAAIVILDLNPGVGDFFGAFLSLRAQQTTPVFYYAVCKDEMHMDWFRTTWIDEMVRLYTAEKLVVPGFSPKPKEPPKAILEAAPPKPELNVLTWLGDQEGRPGYSRGVQVPRQMIDAWYQHPSLGAAFRNFFDEVLQLCGPADQGKQTYTLERARPLDLPNILAKVYSSLDHMCRTHSLCLFKKCRCLTPGFVREFLSVKLDTERVPNKRPCLSPCRAHPACTPILSLGQTWNW